MRFGLVEISGRESSLISARSFARQVQCLQHANPVNVSYVGVSESKLSGLALSGPNGVLGVVAGARLHVCRHNHSGELRAESWQYRNECQLVACEWYAADAAVAILADVSGHVRVLDVLRSTTVRNMPLGVNLSCLHLSKSPIEPTLFVVCLNGLEGCRLIDIRSGSHSQIIGASRFGDCASRAATCSAWSLSNQYECVVGRMDQTVTIFDIRRPQPLHEIRPDESSLSEPAMDLRFSPSGANFFVATTDGRVTGWRVDGDEGCSKPSRSHAFSIRRNHFAKRSRFAVSSDSVYLPHGSSVAIFDAAGVAGTRPTNLPVGLGDITAALWDDYDQKLYTCDENGVVGVGSRSLIHDRSYSNDDLIEWESFSDDSDVNFPRSDLFSDVP